MWDVFLLDTNFVIERPKRYYRQGLHLLHSDTSNEAITASNKDPNTLHMDGDQMTLMGSIRSKVSKIFHQNGHHRAITLSDAHISGDENTSLSSMAPQPAPPMLDPSTNINPLSKDSEHLDELPINNTKGKRGSADVSKHTFYIVNAQMRLKLFARNEVR